MKTEQARHTPTPWAIDSSGNGKSFAIITSTHLSDMDDDVCKVYGGNNDDDDARKANAEFIVQACNSHAQLVEALKTVIAGLEVALKSHDAVPAIKDVLARARAALANA